MSSELSAHVRTARKRAAFKVNVRLLGWALCMPLMAAGIDALNRNFALPLPARALLCLAPLVPGFVFMRHYKRAIAGADELRLLIERDACVFTIFGLVGVFICVDLLENADVLPGFVWTTKTLSLAILCLYGLGVFFTARRYR